MGVGVGGRDGKEARFEFKVIGLLFGLKCHVSTSEKMEERDQHVSTLAVKC